ncbi:unnamed protein product [Peniophora sp. CBMAI 1063]|nr:unnamed protein product [Peniophora sp. CBMAI 1063]
MSSSRSCSRYLGLCTIRVYALLTCQLYLVSTANFDNPVIFWSAGPLCTTIRAKSDATRLAMAWGTVLLYDILIFFLTALRAFRVWNAGSVVHVILRDGVMYFCALTAANVLNIVNFLAAPPLLKPAFASLTNVLSVTFVSRLMLNLRSNSNSDPSLEGDMELHPTQADLDTVILDVETHRFMASMLSPEGSTGLDSPTGGPDS